MKPMMSVSIMNRGVITTVEVNEIEELDVEQIVDDYLMDVKERLILGLMVTYRERSNSWTHNHFTTGQLEEAKQFLAEKIEQELDWTEVVE
jgi:hypothetical protein